MSPAPRPIPSAPSLPGVHRAFVLTPDDKMVFRETFTHGSGDCRLSSIYCCPHKKVVDILR